MTKLMQWLSAGLMFVGLWAPILLGWTPVPVTTNDTLRLHVWLTPVYLVLAFGLVSAAIVMYRVMTFNDCPDAYKELKHQITEAQDDLRRKGFKFE
ncbi:dolichol-phosphate mannosyltransferase subunit 3-like [Oppia nitens]|uniref:dolichol-phosphate mannosyltransferase subunit 3-like n=1 Tax=Oppia nitens TaxID=1686743 RepID=UPI0023DA4404|nr:dolichol-phosphate mannosyltransferase subunit 3-like [Oppia nitens]